MTACWPARGAPPAVRIVKRHMFSTHRGRSGAESTRLRPLARSPHATACSVVRLEGRLLRRARGLLLQLRAESCVHTSSPCARAQGACDSTACHAGRTCAHAWDRCHPLGAGAQACGAASSDQRATRTLRLWMSLLWMKSVVSVGGSPSSEVRQLFSRCSTRTAVKSWRPSMHLRTGQ